MEFSVLKSEFLFKWVYFFVLCWVSFLDNLVFLQLAELWDVCVLFISIHTLGPPITVFQCLFATALIFQFSAQRTVQDEKSIQRKKHLELPVISEILP